MNMKKEKIELTLDEILKSIKSSESKPYDKKIIHTKTGLEFYVQSKERYGDKWFTLACRDDINLKWTGHYTEIKKSFYLEKK